MKINRRDYLKQLGAAGMLAGAAGLDVFAHETADPQQTCLSDPTCTTQRAPLIWQPAWCNDLPANADKCVKLIFEGLTGIAPVRLAGDKVVCEVGFHNKGDAPLHHELSITAHSGITGSTCTSSRNFDQRKIDKVELVVSGPVLDQAYFYERGAA